MKTSCASLLVRFWLLPSLLLTTASAATLYWDGSATTVNSQSDNAITTSQSWVYGGNWDNGNTSAPVASWNSGNAAIFGGTAASQTIIVGTLTIGNLTFGQGPLGVGTSGTTYTISSGTLTLSNSTITANTNATISSVLAGSTGFTKSGVGTLTLTAANTHTGNTTVAGGVLVLENATGSVYTYNGGTISINGPSTLRVTGTGSSKRYDFLGKTFSFDSVGGGRIDLPSVGMNIVFALANNVTNTILTNGGARNNISGGSGLNLGGSSTGKTIFNVARGTDATSDLEVAVQLWNGGAVVKSGDGILSLSSGNTYTGGTTVSGGTLLVQGSINAVTVATGATLGGTGTVAGTATISGTLAPGAGGIGTLTATSTLNLAAAATAEMGVKSASGVLSNDKLTGATTLTYGGTLVVARDPASGDFAIGDQFVLFSAAAYTGAFGNIVLPPLGTGLTWDVSRLTIDGSIGVVSSNATSAPVFNPPPGGYTGAQAVTLTGANGSTIYYTTDGSAPTATSPHGLSPVTGITIPVDSTRTIKAYAAMAGQANSQVISGTYVTVSARTWITAGGGSWSVGTNWQNGGIPDGIGSFADFSKVNLAADATVTLDGSRTLGTLWFGDSVPSHNWFLISGTGGTITLSKVSGSPVIGVANQTATINAVLSGTTGFIKSGEGVLLLAGSSLFTGSLIVSQGELRTSTNFGAGDSNIILGDANTGASNIKWLFNGGGVPANSVEVTNQGTGTVTIGSYSTGTFTQPTGPLTLNRPVILQDGTGDRTSFQGKISGNPGTITLTGARITFSNASSDFTGTLIVSDGTSYQNNAAEVIPDGVDVTMNGSASQFRLNNCSETFNSLNGSGTVYTVVGANFTVTVGAGNGSGSFAGAIQDGTGALNFIKAGTGTQILGGTCTHTGNTTVAAGTLLVTGGIASSPVTVAASGTLGGTGTLGRATTINGFLAPGIGGIGTLSINNTVTLAASATAMMEIKSNSGVRTADKVQGITTVTYGGKLTVTRDPSSSDFAAGDQFVLFSASTYAGAFSAINLPALTGGLIWDTSRLKTDGSIAVAIPGISSPPVFNPPAGSYIGAQTVTLTAAAGARIYYTTDGSQPTASSPSGISPVSGILIPADATRTINAYAATTGNANSQVVSATYETVATPTWINPGGGSWPVGANWQSGVVATGGIGMTADFSKVNLTSDTAVTLDGTRTLGSLLFGDGVPSHNWTLATGGTGVLTLDTASGTPTIGVANQATTISAVLAGTKGFTKTGAVALILSAPNPYSGLTTVSAGALEVLAKSGDGPYAVAQGATLKLGYTTGGGYANTGMGISGNGVSATTGLYLKGGSSYNVSGGMTIQTAPTTIRQYGTGYASIGMFDINDNGLTVQAAASGSVIDENIQIVSRGYGMSVSTVPGAATATGDLVINGPLNITLAQTGITLGFYKRGAGSVRLNGVATPDNMAVQVQAGTLIAGVEDAIRNNTGLGVSSGAKVVLNGFDQTVGSLSGAGSITGGAVPVAVLTANQAVARIFSGVIGGSGSNDNNLALTKAGSATLTLSGANTYTGPTTVNGGILQASGAASTCFGNLSAVTLNNAASLDLNGTNQVIGSLAGASTAAMVTLGAGTLTTGGNGTNSTYAGGVNGAGGLTKIGPSTQTVAGTCTHTGSTTVAAGTLLVNGSVASSPVTVAVGGTLGGAGTLGRATTVNGTLAPGNNGVGALTITGTLTLAATATTLMEISKSGGTATFDRVLGVTSLTQGGTLTVTTSGEALQVGDSFRLFTATTYTGAFATVNLPTSYVWDTSQLKTNGSVTVTAINQSPVFGGYAVATPYQKSVTILVRKLLSKASDPDGDALGVTTTGPTSANGGTAVLQGSSILYTPANNFSGADTFPVAIADARGATVIGTVTMTVGSGPSGGGAGSNPPVLTVLPDGKMGLAFQGIPGRSYIVQRSASGLDNWVTLATIPADASGKVAYTDESPPAGSAFYRLGLP